MYFSKLLLRNSISMKKLLWLGAVGISVFAFVSVAQAQDVGFENIFESVSVDLKVNGQDGPVTVNSGDRIVVSWLSEGAARCKGNWSKNDIKTSGTVSGRISRSVVIKAACIDKENNRDDDAVVVNVTGKPAVTTPVPVTPTTSAQPRQLVCGSVGDVNGDGVISQTDADLVAQLVAGSRTPSAVELVRADVSGDGELKANDITLINRYLAGMDSTFPRCTGASTTTSAQELPNMTLSKATVNSGEMFKVNFTFPRNGLGSRLYITCPASVSTRTTSELCNSSVDVTSNTDWTLIFYNTSTQTQRVQLSYNVTLPNNAGVGGVGGFVDVLPAPTTSAQPKITVLSPNGGENYKVGDTINVRWNVANIPANTTVGLQISYSSNAVVYEDVIVSENLQPDLKGGHSWVIPTKYGGSSMNPNLFKMRAILYGSAIKDTSQFQDYSDSYFTITAPAPTASPITVDLKANKGDGANDGPITVAAGTSIGLLYTTTGKVERCTGDVEGGSNGSKRIIASESKTYTVSCTQDGGTGTASDSVRVEVTQAITEITPATAPVLSASAPTISGTRTAAGDKLYPGSMSITSTIQNSGGPLTTSVSARFQYSPNNGANWYDFQEVGPISTTPKNVSHTWDGGVGNFCFRVAIDSGTDNIGPSACIEILPQAGAFIGVSRELAATAVPDTDVWNFLKAFFGR